MDIFLRIAGVLMILIVIQDVFFTVLFSAASGHGIIQGPLTHWIWSIFKVIGKRMSGRRRRRVLSYAGPVQIIVQAGVWFFLLLFGWAMIYKPVLGSSIAASSGPTDTSWATAIYYSGYTVTTLGTGDVAANTGLYRLLTVAETIVGFTILSMVVTYFLSIYPNLLSRNAFAQGMHHWSGGSDDAAELIAQLIDRSDLPSNVSGVRQQLATKAGTLREIYQAHRFYPVLRYFRYAEPYYELPRVLLTTLDTVTLMRGALDKEFYAGLIQSSELNEFSEVALALIRELVPDVRPITPSEADAARWRARYADAIQCFAQARLEVRPDVDGGAEEYVERRAEWDMPIRVLAGIMLHEWHATAGMPVQPALS